MTIAELVFLAAGAAVVYALLRPLQRRLERYLLGLIARRLRRPPLIDVTRYSTHSVHRKDDDEHRG